MLNVGYASLTTTRGWQAASAVAGRTIPAATAQAACCLLALAVVVAVGVVIAGRRRASNSLKGV